MVEIFQDRNPWKMDISFNISLNHQCLDTILFRSFKNQWNRLPLVVHCVCMCVWDISDSWWNSRHDICQIIYTNRLWTVAFWWKRNTFVGKLSLLVDEWSPLRALSACGQILKKKSRQGSDPPSFRQCLYFGSFCSWHPSLTSKDAISVKKPSE